MRKIRDVLRLRWILDLSCRQISRSCRVAHGTVNEYVVRAEEAGLSWEQVEQMDDTELEGKLFPSQRQEHCSAKLAPDWAQIHQELRKKSVTRALLWQEYREDKPKGYSYSRFCELYAAFEKTLDVSLRQDYKAGEKLFVDFSGETVDMVDRQTGEVRQAEIFVAVLGASNYTYAKATWSQSLEDWIGAHVATFEFLGSVPEIVVPDNLKSGVKKPCRYEPEENPAYAEMASHYGVAVIPCRVRKPRDKAKVENGVLQVQRWILARLRKQTFFSLRELNQAIGKLLEELNDRPMKVLKVSRREVFEQIERPALRPLPERSYEYADWKKVRVGPDYHVEYKGHYYSVAYQLIRQELEVRATARTIEVFHKSVRVTAHRRSSRKGHHTTLKEHMPKAHQEHLEWTPVRLVKWAAKTGEGTAELVEAILRSRPHPQQGFRSCLGLMRLGKKYGAQRLEAACRRALKIQSLSYQSVKSILQSGLDQQPLVTESPVVTPAHRNVRGAAYYARPESEEGSSC